MPTNFLDLPRELRDQIYNHVLLSPTLLIAPRHFRHISKPLIPTRHAFKPLQPNPHNPQPRPKSRYKLLLNPLSPSSEAEYTSLSILRTNKQIHEETKDIIYLNTFQFTTSPPESLHKTLKSMGQTSSRKITSISLILSTNHPTSTKHLGRIMQVLSSRARFGYFRNLEIVFPEMVLRTWFVGLKRSSRRLFAPMIEDFEDLLEGLEVGSRTGLYERTVRFQMPEKREEWVKLGLGVIEEVSRDVHFAAKGKVWFGERLAWEEFRMCKIVGADGVKRWDGMVWP